jgi:hypothetical protein
MSAEKAKLQHKIYFSTNGLTVPVWDETGMHVAHVTPDGTELHPRFWVNALRLGCSTEGFELKATQSYVPADPLDEVKSVLMGMVSNPQEGDFTAAGLPDLRRVAKLAGYNVPRDQMLEAWAEVHKQLSE